VKTEDLLDSKYYILHHDYVVKLIVNFSSFKDVSSYVGK